MPLLTAAEARAIGFKELSSTGLDTTIDLWIARATSALASHCWYPTPSTGARPTLESATYIQYLRGNPDDPRRLATHFTHGRLVSVTTVYDDPALDWGSDTLVAAGDYPTIIQPDGVILLSSTSAHGAWGSAIEGQIKLTHVGGWTSSTVPFEVQEALGLMCSHYSRLKVEQGHGSVSASGGSISTQPETIPAQVAEIMAPFRMLGRGF